MTLWGGRPRQQLLTVHLERGAIAARCIGQTSVIAIVISRPGARSPAPARRMHVATERDVECNIEDKRAHQDPQLHAMMFEVCPVSPQKRMKKGNLLTLTKINRRGERAVRCATICERSDHVEK